MEPVKDTDPTIGKLAVDVSRDLDALVKQHVALAKAELTVSAKAGGMAIGLFAAAAFVALLSLIFFFITVAYFINWGGSGLSLHWAFLIVFGFQLLVAAGLGLFGYRKVKGVKAPERSIAQGKELPKAFKGQA